MFSMINSTSNKTGTGLGLFISKKLALKLSDSINPTAISVESEINVGTTFSFLLENKLPSEINKEFKNLSDLFHEQN